MKRLVCFGDSITMREEGLQIPMLRAKLSNFLPNFEIINAGISGDNTIGALARVEKDVIHYEPDYVTVLFGANDSAFHKTVPLQIYKENLLSITKRIGPEKVILISPAPVDETKQFKRSNKVLATYTAAVKEVAEETNAYFIDFYQDMISRTDYQEKLSGMKNDGLHFGEAGYNILAQLIADKIKEITV